MRRARHPVRGRLRPVRRRPGSEALAEAGIRPPEIVGPGARQLAPRPSRTWSSPGPGLGVASPGFPSQPGSACSSLLRDAGAAAAFAARLDLLAAVVAPPGRPQPEEAMRASGERTQHGRSFPATPDSQKRGAGAKGLEPPHLANQYGGCGSYWMYRRTSRALSGEPRRPTR